MSRVLDHVTPRVRVTHADFFPFGPPQEPLRRSPSDPIPISLDDPGMGVFSLDPHGHILGWRPLDLAERFELYSKSPRSHGRVSW
jgi:hypothetical protein